MTDWKLLSTSCPYDGKGSAAGRVRVDRVRVRDGVERDFVVLEGADVAIVVPVHDDGRVVLVRQMRWAWSATGWECPAGHLDPGETPEQAARRELEEESGWRAGELDRLLPPFFASAKTAARFHAFVARRLEHKGARPDEDEELEPRAFTSDEARALIASGEVLHGPSVLALFAFFARS
jgi:ADP-ribose pyrophosphatase